MAFIACYLSVLTMPKQRTYRTNLAFEATDAQLREKYSAYTSGAQYRGNETFRLPQFPENAVQITTNGFVKIHNSTREIDAQILQIITPDIVTRDSRPFNWAFSRETTGEKEERRNVLRASLALVDNLLREVETNEYFVSHLNGEGILTNFPSYLEKTNYARRLLALIPTVDQMDYSTISENREKVREAIAQLDQIRSELDEIQQLIDSEP